MAVCHSCGTVNPAQAVSCRHCGLPVSPPSGPVYPLGPSKTAAGSGARPNVVHALFGESPPLAGQRFSITNAGLVVGRTKQGSQNQIVLEDPEVSRQHARLCLTEQGRVEVEDWSVNGTFVNNRRVEKAVLEIGDRIRFGRNPANTLVYRTYLADGAGVPQPVGRSADLAASPATPSSRPPGTLHLPPEVKPAEYPRLQLVLDQYAVEDHVLQGSRTELGRKAGPNCVAINHPTVSERHAEVVFTDDGRAILRDLGSIHGTYVNGERIKQSLLREGDLIQMGQCESRLLLYREPHHHSLVLRDIELNRPMSSLGRDPGNSIRLNHPTVSLFHAEIHKHDGTFELSDKNSTNGTYVNGVRITRHRLRARDRITLGAIQLVFDGNHIDQQIEGSGIRLYACGLCRSVKDRNTGRPIRLLDGISLSIEPRELVGLLGPAGCGKTTLIHALNGSHPASSGRVLLNRSDLYREYAALRAVMGYLPQEDILHRALTTKECLYYAARLRLPDDFSEADIWARVFDVIKMLDLSERADVQIKHLSGGQRKRVSLAIELLCKPSLLFMDEPTAGQDPRTEMKMMQHFREIANQGATVVATTHLLSSFSLLDKVGVLVRGRLAYYGPGQDMLSYFKTTRPTEVYDVLQQRTSEEWAKRYQNSEYCQDNAGEALEEGSAGSRLPSPTTAALPARGHSRLRQLLTLLRRQLALRLRGWSSLAALLLPSFAIAFLVGLMKREPNEPKVLFMIVFSALWFGCSAAVREIVDEDATYRRERERNLTIFSYLGSKLVYVLGLAIVQSGLFISVLTLMDAQQNHFLESWGIMCFMTIQGSMIGLLISALSTSPEKALYVFPLALIPQLLLAGLFVPIGNPQPVIPVANEAGIYEFQTLPEEIVPHGMSPILRDFISPLMVSRWGLESLADLYIHDWNPGSLVLLNALTITFHPNDGKEARESLELANRNRREGNIAITPTPQSRPATPAYMLVLAGFLVVMVVLTAIALKARDAGGHP